MQKNKVFYKKPVFILICSIILLVGILIKTNVLKINVSNLTANLSKINVSNLTANLLNSTSSNVPVENLGYPFQTAPLTGMSMFKDGNGDSHWFGGYTSGGPTQIIDINLKTGNINLFDIKKRGGVSAQAISGNKLFMGLGQCTILEYDIASGTFTERRASNWANGYCGTSSGDSIAYSAYTAPDGMIYFGTATRGTLFELDPSTGVIRDFGMIDVPPSNPSCSGCGTRYVATVVADDNYIYNGMRDTSTNSWWLAIVNRKDGSLSDSCWRDDKLNAGRISASVNGKEIWYGNNSGQYRVDNTGGKCPTIKGRAPALKPWWYPSNIYAPGADAYATSGSAFGFDIDASGMTADNNNGGVVTFKYSPAGSGSYKTLTQAIKITNTGIRRIKAINATSMYLGSGGYGPNAIFDGTRTTALGTLPQSLYAITPAGQYVYFSGYTANTFRYTPASPWTVVGNPPTTCTVASPSNPCLAFQGMGKYHYYSVLANDGLLYIASDYTRAGRNGGDIGWIDPTTGKTGSKAFMCDNPRGFALLSDGTTLAYSSDEDGGSYGCTNTEGKVFLFDTKTKKITNSFAPIPGHDEQGTIVGTNDGGILGIQKGYPVAGQYTVYKVDTNGNHASWSPMVLNGSIFSATSRPDYRLVMDQNGMIYTWDDNGIIKINPADGSNKLIAKISAVTYIELVGNDLYISTGTTLKRIKGVTADTLTILSSINTITAFNFNSFAPSVKGVFYGEKGLISLTVPFGTNVTSLVPTITTGGVSVSPGNNVAQDFTNPVTYTVTAEDGSNRQYVVTVIVDPNPTTATTKTTTTNKNTINTTTNTSTVTTTAVNTKTGTPETPKVTTPTTPTTTTIVVPPPPALSSKKYMTAFGLNSFSPAIKGTVGERGVVSVTVPVGTNVTALVPTIAFVGKSISPNNNVAQDFTNPVTYTVTAEDGSNRQYVVTVKIAP